MEPSVNVVYQDVWTNPSVRAPDASFSYSYLDPSITTNVPTPETLHDHLVEHSAASRSTTRRHIQPLWDKVRQMHRSHDRRRHLADHTCTQGGCHSAKSATATAQIPARPAQFDEHALDR